jgi:PBP1b-binding outer membrane lipoprotein LpoB
LTPDDVSLMIEFAVNDLAKAQVANNGYHLVVARLENRTRQHLDTKQFVEEVKHRLTILKAFKMDDDSVDRSSSGPVLVLSGSLGGNQQMEEGIRIASYELLLKVVDSTTRTIVWMNRQTIRKQQENQ